MSRFVAVVLVLVPALAQADGVIAGHPVDFRFAAGNGLTYTAGSAEVGNVVFEYCDASTLTVALDETLDLGDEFMLPDGCLVGVRLDLTGPVLLAGTGDAGGSFTIDLEMASINVVIDPSITITTSSTTPSYLEMAFPNWIDGDVLNLGPGTSVAIDPSSGSLYTTLKADVRNGSRLVP